MISLTILSILGILFHSVIVLASPLVNNSTLQERADSSLVGYFFVHFYDREPSIFAHLSNGNNALSYTPLNGDKAILKSTVGTKAARDPYLVSRNDQSMHWIIATDLDIVALGNNWGTAVTHGSRSIIVWSSPDLVTWSASRLAQVMPATAGMVWAPEAVWDSSTNSFLVHWASRVFAASDTAHTGTASLDQLWYSHTTDFITFTTAQPYIALSATPVIDLTFLFVGGTTYIRFIKDESRLRVWQERSTTGLLGTWTKIGGDVSNSVTEGPLTFWDNVTANRAYVFLDDYGSGGALGYIPFQTDNVGAGVWTKSSVTNFPKLTKHGVVKPVTQAQFNLIKARWP